MGFLEETTPPPVVALLVGPEAIEDFGYAAEDLGTNDFGYTYYFCAAPTDGLATLSPPII